jgi:hypothetical protein
MSQSDDQQPLHEHPHGRHLTLSEEDARAVDALLSARADASAGPTLRLTSDEGSNAPIDPARLNRVAAVLKVLDQCPASDPPEDLTKRTLARIAQSRGRERMLAEMGIGGGGSGGRGFGWGEMVAAAAVLIIGVSLALPMLDYHRQEARRVACLGNLGSVAKAMGTYAAISNGQAPRLGAWPGEPWYQVGQQREPTSLASYPSNPSNPSNQPENKVRSNSANLYMLARQGFVKPDDLACPENINATHNMTSRQTDWPDMRSVSYSYQNQYAAQPVRLDNNPNIALLADKNPLFAAGSARNSFAMTGLPTSAPSQVHQKRGQNVVLANGSVKWQPKPVLANGDNIWSARGVDRYTGNESPTDASDSFLVP